MSHFTFVWNVWLITIIDRLRPLGHVTYSGYQTSTNMAATESRCCCCEVHDDCCICLFKQSFSFSKSLKNIPEFVPETLPEWLSRASKDSSRKSWKFYKEHYVHDVVVARNVASVAPPPAPCPTPSTSFSSSSEHLIKARCYHSMSKRQPAHFLWFQVTSHNNGARVLSAHCSCKAGAGGICNHAYAVIYDDRLLQWQRW